MMNRRDFVRNALGAGALTIIAPRVLHATAPIAMTVYKSPTCGCCKEWIKHVEKNGFAVKAIDMDDPTPMRRTAGVPLNMASCHTALVGAYVVEGHVPADLIKQMLAEKPAIRGLAVPGMIAGTPGMEDGGLPRPYRVMAFMKDGSSRLYATR